MFNIIKSDLYRLFKSKGFYIVIGVVIIIILKNIYKFRVDNKGLPVCSVKPRVLLEKDALPAVENHLIHDLRIILQPVFRDPVDPDIRSPEFGHPPGVKPIAVLFLGIENHHMVLRVDFFVKEPLRPLLRRVQGKGLRVQNTSSSSAETPNTT